MLNNKKPTSCSRSCCRRHQGHLRYISFKTIPLVVEQQTTSYLLSQLLQAAPGALVQEAQCHVKRRAAPHLHSQSMLGCKVQWGACSEMPYICTPEHAGGQLFAPRGTHTHYSGVDRGQGHGHHWQLRLSEVSVTLSQQRACQSVPGCGVANRAPKQQLARTKQIACSGWYPGSKWNSS